MKGVIRHSDLHAPARLLYEDGRYDRDEWRAAYKAIGSTPARLRYLGDRLLDALEARHMRDRTDLPPGLLVLINDYRALMKLPSIRTNNTLVAHTSVLRAQSTLLDREIVRTLLRNHEETW